MIICSKYDALGSSLLHTKLELGPAAPQKIFEGFLPDLDFAAILRMRQTSYSYSSFSWKITYQVLFKVDQWFLRKVF